MMVPHKFAHIAVSHGTIGVIADPHEIGNVLGIEGVDYMIRSGRKACFNFCFGAPSCVPAVGGNVETCGKVIDVKDIEVLMAREDIGFLAEMMNFPGVLASTASGNSLKRSSMTQTKSLGCTPKSTN